MHALLKKMNLKEGKKIHLLNPPASFEKTISEFDSEIEILRTVREPVQFILIFCENAEHIQNGVDEIKDQLTRESIVWFAYPKKSSKNYTSDITRDNGWSPLGEIGMEGVRQVAVDEDWSALRFKFVNEIKSFTRNTKMVLSDAGKQRKASQN